MLYSAAHGFVYLKTGKTGGTSVEVALEPLCAPPGHVPQHATAALVSDYGIIGARGPGAKTETRWFNHMPAFVVRSRLGPAVFDACRRVACLRNPFDKAVSAFWFLHRDSVPEPVPDRIEAFRSGLKKQIPDPRTLRETTADWRACHVDGRYVVTDPLRFEALEADTNAFVLSLGLPPLEGAFPRLKAQHRQADTLPVSAYFDEVSADLVRRAFDWMFEAGGYALDPREADRQRAARSAEASA